MALEGKKCCALMAVASYEIEILKCLLGCYRGCESLPGQWQRHPHFSAISSLKCLSLLDGWTASTLKQIAKPF